MSGNKNIEEKKHYTLLPEEVDCDKITYGPVMNRGGLSMITTTYNNEGFLCIESPWLIAPFGVMTYEQPGKRLKHTTVLAFSENERSKVDELKAMLSLIECIDHHFGVVEASKRWAEWGFPTKEDAMRAYKKLVHLDRNGTEPPSFRVKLPFLGSVADFPAYNDKRQTVDLTTDTIREIIRPRSRVRCHLRLMPLWRAANDNGEEAWGVTLKAELLQYAGPPKTVKGFDFRR